MVRRPTLRAGEVTASKACIVTQRAGLGAQKQTMKEK